MTTPAARPLPGPPPRGQVAAVASGAVIGVAAVLVVLGLAGDITWLLVAAWVLVVLGVVGAVRDALVRRRLTREWDTVPTAAVAPHVDLVGLSAVRRDRGEIAAIRALMKELPGCPLRRSRDLVAELTGVPHGS